MNCISIQQPWPWAILFLGKPVENRDWMTKFRGRTLIHAGQKFDKYGAEWIEDTFNVYVPTDLPRGGIVGSINIVNCVDRFNSKWFFGKYGYLLKDPVPLPFEQSKGRLGFYNVDFIYPLRDPHSKGLLMSRTWSGQCEEHAWHWNDVTYKKLGDIVFLIYTGVSENRTKAYYLYIQLKGWFIPHEFETFMDKLDKLRKDAGVKPLRDIITEIYREMLPVSNWKAKDGIQYSDIMPPLNDLVPVEKQKPNGELSTIPSTTVPVAAPVIQTVTQPAQVIKPKTLEVEQLALELF